MLEDNTETDVGGKGNGDMNRAQLIWSRKQ
jgi:hypothetical protein